MAHRCVKALVSMAAVVGNYSTGMGILPQNVPSKFEIVDSEPACVSTCAPLLDEALARGTIGDF